MADAQEVKSTQEVRQTQTTIPDYAKRYVEDLLGQGAATIYRTNGVDSSGMPNITGFQPYRAYQGDRVAQFTPLQQQAFSAAGQLGVPDQMYNASQIAQRAATMAGQSAYNPSTFQAGMAMAPNLERFQMGPAQQVYSRENNAPTMSAAQMSYDPRLSNYQMGAAQQVTADRVGTPTMTAARMNFDPNLRNYQMGPAQEVRTQSFARPELPTCTCRRTCRVLLISSSGKHKDKQALPRHSVVPSLPAQVLLAVPDKLSRTRKRSAIWPHRWATFRPRGCKAPTNRHSSSSTPTKPALWQQGSPTNKQV